MPLQTQAFFRIYVLINPRYQDRKSPNAACRPKGRIFIEIIREKLEEEMVSNVVSRLANNKRFEVKDGALFSYDSKKV